VSVYRRGPRRSVLILIVLTAVTLITLDARSSGFLDGLRGGARDLLSPVASVFDTVFSPVGDWMSGVTHAGSLRDENARLREQLDEARGRLDAAEAIEAENVQLRELVDLPFLQDADTTSAEVIAGSPGNFQSTVVIDRGTNDGVAEGMPVVSGAGLVGRIVDVSRDQSTVQLLDDPEFGVGVRFTNAEETAVAILGGRTDSDELNMSNLEPTSYAIADDELAVTLGGEDSAYPSGIPVARVSSIESRGPGQAPDVLLRPLVDLDGLRFVKVITGSGA
jgi:rod shape-determining protein MreC